MYLPKYAIRSLKESVVGRLPPMRRSEGNSRSYTWPRFASEIRDTRPLLSELERYRRSILVAGCQRSGTTALARVLMSVPGLKSAPALTCDDELDAALVLSGAAPYAASGRHCFQTTYLNQSFYEYLTMGSEHRLIWVVRDPVSVVHSMLTNWSAFALTELFEACGATALPEALRRRYLRWGAISIPALLRACYAYAGKTEQAILLSRQLGGRMRVVDYAPLVSDRGSTLRDLFEFLELDYLPVYASGLHGGSLSKAKGLSERERMTVERICTSTYERVRSLTGARAA